MYVEKSNNFIEAYRQRIMYQNVNRHMQAKGKVKITARLNKSSLQEKPAAKMTLSYKEFYQTEMAARLNDVGSDEFVVYGNDQWLVFNKFLYDTGLYDKMSGEDIKTMEQLLMNITDELDNVFMWGHNAQLDFHGKLLDLYEARLGLESSVTALRYFAENLIDKTNKGDFVKLIDKYYTHNNKILTSIEEKIISDCSRLSGANDRFNMIIHSREEIDNFTMEISNLFRNIDKENLTDILQQVRDRVLVFMMGEVDNEKLKGFIINHASEMFGSMNDYWSDLVETVEKDTEGWLFLATFKRKMNKKPIPFYFLFTMVIISLIVIFKLYRL